MCHSENNPDDLGSCGLENQSPSDSVRHSVGTEYAFN